MSKLGGRLRKGAEVLGVFFRQGECCREAWNVPDTFTREAACACEPKANFCKAKAQWLDMATHDTLPREVVHGEWGLVFTMLASEWDATGLTLVLRSSEEGEIRLGPKGSIKMGDLGRMGIATEAYASVVKILTHFPGSRVEGMIKAPERPVEKEAEPVA